MAEKRGAGSMLSGVLERGPRPEAAAIEETVPIGTVSEPAPKGRGAQPKRAPKPKATGRTIYLDDDLFERIIVQAHRRKLTISDYVANLLNRHVPDHRRIVSGPAEADDAA